MWSLIWFSVVDESPQRDRFIKKAELDYINASLGVTSDKVMSQMRCLIRNSLRIHFLASCGAMEGHFHLYAVLGHHSGALDRKLGILHHADAATDVSKG